MELQDRLAFLLQDDYLLDGPKAVRHGEEVVLSDVAGKIAKMNDFRRLSVEIPTGTRI